MSLRSLSQGARKLSMTLLCGVGLLALLGAAPALARASEDGGASVQTRSHNPLFGALQPPLPDVTEFPRQLVLDDDSAESDFGVSGATSEPFLWFNRFSPQLPFVLEQMWVLFPQSTVLNGAAIQLAIYQDLDGDPTNGAQLLATLDRTVLENDGVTFSIYDVDPPIEVISGDLYLGVISRYAETPTPPTFPAPVDTGASQGRSWFAIWNGGPPAVPELPGDDETLLIDDVLPGGGNFLIRGFGRAGGTIVEVPALDMWGLALMTLLLSVAGLVAILRRPARGSVKRK